MNVGNNFIDQSAVEWQSNELLVRLTFLVASHIILNGGLRGA